MREIKCENCGAFRVNLLGGNLRGNFPSGGPPPFELEGEGGQEQILDLRNSKFMIVKFYTYFQGPWTQHFTWWGRGRGRRGTHGITCRECRRRRGRGSGGGC